MAPEIQSETYRNFCSFGSFFALLLPWQSGKTNFWKKWNKHLQRCYHCTCSYQKWQSYDVWFLRYGLKETDFFVILGQCLLLYTLSFSSPNNQENKKQSYGYYPFILLYVCTINEDYLMHGSWDIRHNRLEIFGRFLPFYPLPPDHPGSENIEKIKKKTWTYYHFTHMYQKWRSYYVWVLIYGVLQTYFFVNLGQFLPFHTLTI